MRSSNDLPAVLPLCVAVGAAAGAHGLPLEPALAVFLQAFASNLAQAAIRLGVTGQSGAVSVVAALEGKVLEAASRAAHSTLDDLGSATVHLGNHVDATRNPVFPAVPLMTAITVPATKELLP